MQPVLDAPPAVVPYERGTWGPAEADALTSGHGGWHEPWRPPDPGSDLRTAAVTDS